MLDCYFLNTLFFLTVVQCCECLVCWQWLRILGLDFAKFILGVLVAGLECHAMRVIVAPGDFACTTAWNM